MVETWIVPQSLHLLSKMADIDVELRHEVPPQDILREAQPDELQIDLTESQSVSSQHICLCLRKISRAAFQAIHPSRESLAAVVSEANFQIRCLLPEQTEA